jgi:ADP-ribose pyrophosphatase YjhB (NUDIX family)
MSSNAVANARTHVSRAAVELDAVVVDDAGLVLMERTGTGLALPGGPLLAGEQASEGIVRVVDEVTGVRVEVCDLVGVSSSPGFGVCFRARPIGGDLGERAEWVEPERLGELPVDGADRRRVEHVLAERAAYFG